MAEVLALCASARPKGWTKGLLDAACAEAAKVPGVNVTVVNLHKYKFEPCLACFSCIRDPEHKCIRKDSMGKNGDLLELVNKANAIILADPVFLWGPSALCHMFMERMYPFIWSGALNGLPFGSISCASNSGFQYQASQDIARLVFGFGFRYLGCVPAHASYYDESMVAAGELGKKIAEAALKDEAGREKITDREKFALYEKPWNVLEDYAVNLLRGSTDKEDIMPKHAIKTDSFKKDRAKEVLYPAAEKLGAMYEALEAGNIDEARQLMSDGSALWTEATWREFLEEDVIGVTKPAAYRPVDELL